MNLTISHILQKQCKWSQNICTKYMDTFELDIHITAKTEMEWTREQKQQQQQWSNMCFTSAKAMLFFF